MSFFVPLRGSAAPSFTSATLVLPHRTSNGRRVQPQPSLASLAQLACDLIVHNYRLELVGYLALQDHVPAVGARDSLPGQPAQNGIALGCEVFATPDRSLFIALPRSPVIHARRANYLDSIERWIAQSGFKEVLVVAGADAAMRGDDGLNEITPLRHLTPNSSASTSSHLLTTLRQISPSYLTSAPSGFQSTSEAAALPSDSIPPIPHGGLTRQLLTTLTTAAPSSPSRSDSPTAPKVDIAALLIYTSEGAASESAHFLADALSYLLEPQLAALEDRVERVSPTPASGGIRGGEGETGAAQGSDKGNVEWKEPISWERGLLGPELARDAGREMYG
ncbi:hypothetical protein BMF94_4616 [Rhodotorula taiwanensis]|uniref:Proteasome assembly chaperone 2 n=1 Tax=Rhodotorula taiwanensis TaxID=741276 RepID=A0A2S5B6A0_9BASI|nr:hypothetical protein BMF94_4616 [Rhodotorula taiwanensis]